MESCAILYLEPLDHVSLAPSPSLHSVALALSRINAIPAVATFDYLCSSSLSPSARFLFFEPHSLVAYGGVSSSSGEARPPDKRVLPNKNRSGVDS